jgi:peroxiredoxin
VQLRGDRTGFREIGVRVALVGLGSPERAGWFCKDKHLSLPFLCLTDPSGGAHRDYELRHGTTRQVFGPQLYSRWATLNLNAETRQRAPQEDWRQLPGTFVIDLDGIVRYAHRNKDVGDNPSNDEIFAVLRKKSGRRAPRKKARST